MLCSSVVNVSKVLAVSDTCFGEFSVDEFDVHGISVSVLQVIPTDFLGVRKGIVFFADTMLGKLVADAPERGFREGIVLLDLEEVISVLLVRTIPLRCLITDSLVVIVVKDFPDCIDDFERTFFDSSYVCSSVPIFRFVEAKVAAEGCDVIDCCSGVNLRDVEDVDNLIRYGEDRGSLLEACAVDVF